MVVGVGVVCGGADLGIMDRLGFVVYVFVLGNLSRAIGKIELLIYDRRERFGGRTERELHCYGARVVCWFEALLGCCRQSVGAVDHISGGFVHYGAANDVGLVGNESGIGNLVYDLVLGGA